MSSVNKVILVGRCGQDPELSIHGETTVARLSIATSRKTKGEEKTEWHNITFFNKLAQIAGEYLRKGSLVYIEGSLQTDKWEKDGVTRTSTKVIANQMQMLGDKPKTDSLGAQNAGGVAPKELENEDIPF